MKAVLTNAHRFTEEEQKLVKELGYDITLFNNIDKPLTEDLFDAEVLVTNFTFLQKKLSDLPKFNKLKFLQITSAGIDKVPLDLLREKGIRLCNARGIYSIPIGEWVVLKILEFYKKSRLFEENQRNNKWKFDNNLLEIYGKTVTIVGTGSLGTEAAKRLSAFGCKVIGLNTSGRQVEHFDECYSIDKLNDILAISDVVALTVPLTDKTKDLIDKDNLKLMKDNAILINVARGGVINEEDLLEHLNEGKLLGAALDVVAKEPLSPDSPLWKHERVMITPHNSYSGDNNDSRMFQLIYGNLKAFINNESLKNEIKL